MGILRECFSDAGNQQSEFFLGVKSAAQNPSSSPAAYNVLDQRSCVQSQAHFTDSSLEKSSHFKDGESCWFSTSFPDIFQKRLSLTANNSSSCNCHVIGSLSQGNQNAYDQSFEELESYAVRNLLPDDDELLSGIADEHHYFAHSSNIADEAEDFDLFSSGGGLELDADNRDTSITSTNKVLDLFAGAANAQHSSSNASMIGGHPYGEHPSRTLFVRNINSNVDDSELQALFEQYGKIRALYSACKHRGFVMVSYYDIRSAQSAMKALQNKPLRKRKLDIHFSIPKDNPTDKDINQGTLVVFNLDPSVSNDKLSQIFGVYGEVREIRETPHKSHHKFIEFYDVRAAEAALKALNKSDIAGKQIKLEPSRPGGARRVMQQFYQDFEQEASHSSLHRRTSPAINASSWGEITKGISRSCLDDSPVQMSPGTNILNSVFPERALLGTPSSASLSLTTSVKVPTSNHLAGQSIQGEAEHHLGHRDIQIHSMPSHNAYLLPEFSKQILNSLPHISPSLVSAISPITSNLVLESTESAHNRVLHGIQPNNLNNLRYDHENADHRTNISSPINGNQFNWESADCHYHCVQNSVMSSEASAYANPMFAQPLSQQEGKMLPRTNRHMGATLALQNCSIGSAPISGPVHFLRRDGHAESPETSLFHAGSSTSLKTFSPQKRCSAFSHSPVVGSLPGFQRNTNERGRNRRSDNANQIDSKKHFQLDVDKILSGEDTRTTLMIKNIPNKYTSKLLLATIDEHYRGTYDFIYLPIDFKNKCNVGYSFINMTNPMHVVPFYKAFNGKRWEKFNSEKVASLAYARIQGKAALIAHFQNSSLMNEDKRCRPIIFHTDGPNAGDQEPFPVGLNVRIRPGKNRNRNFGSHQGSPDSENAEDDNTHGSQSSQDSLRRRENR